jgi:autotransporter-associated beta strand protein
MNPKVSTAKNLPGARSWRSCLQLLVALAILGWGSMARAIQSDTWVGGGADNNWTTTNNWNVGGSLAVGMTTNGDALTFGVSTTMNPNNNFQSIGITNIGIGSITLNASGYAIGGNAIQITNGITDNVGSNTLSIPLILGASQTFQNNSGSGYTNTESGTINLRTNTLTIGGGAPLFLTGVISSTNGGQLIVNNYVNARLGAANGFGTNLTSVSTSLIPYSTNIVGGVTNYVYFLYSTNSTYYTNLYVLITNGVSTNYFYTYITNNVISSNFVASLATNSIVKVQDAVTVQGGGVLQLNNGGALPSGASVGNFKLDGTLDLNGQSPTINGLEDSGSGGGLVDNLAGTGIYTLTVGNGNSNGVFKGVIQNTSGSVGLTKTGYGTETLTTVNQYGGPTIINQGTLVVLSGATLGALSTTLTIGSGAVLDVSGLGAQGYLPYGPLTVAAGTPTKPFTNFLGSFTGNPTVTPAYDPSYGTNFVVILGTNNFLTYVTNVVAGVSTNVFITTNFVSLAYSTNSIVSIINADVNGNFTVNGGGAISPITSISPGIATWTIHGNLTMDESYNLIGNRVNFLLNDTTTPGGGTNDLISVSGGLSIGNELDFVITPLTGTLASGTYTLITSSGYTNNTPNFYSGRAPANLVLVEARGLQNDTISVSGNNIVLNSAGGTATPGSIVWTGTPARNNWDVHLTQNWSLGGTADYFYPLDNVTFDDSGVATVVLPVVVAPGSVNFNNLKTNYTFAANASTFITGPGGITLNCRDQNTTVTLNNPNSFTGPVTINNGTLILGNYGGNGNAELYNGIAPGQLVFGSGNGIFEINAALASVSSQASLAGLTLSPGANAQIFIPGRGASDYALITIDTNINRSVGSSLFMNISIKGGQANNGVYFANTIPWTNGLLGGGWAHIGTDWLLASTNFGSGGASPASGIYNYAGYSNNAALAFWLPTNNISVSNSTAAVTASVKVNTLKLSGPATVTITSGMTLTNATGGLLVSSGGAGPSTILGGTLMGAAGADLIVLQNYTPSPLYIGSVIADNGSATALTLGGTGGTVILTNNSTYTGATYLNGGTLQIGNGTPLGSIATSSAVYDNGILTFNRPDAASLNGAVSGLGSLTQLGTGTLTLLGNNTLSGLVTVSAGTLQLGNGGPAGSVSNAVGIVDNGTLAFNNNNTVGYPNVISGLGMVVNAGTGVLIIATNETYTGNTIVSNGTVLLTASGTISNTPAIIVNAGAVLDVSAAGLTLRSAAPSEILAGNGSVKGAVTTASGTTLSPGTNGVIGTLTLNNNLNLNAGKYVFDVGTNANDKILVGGNLNEGGGVAIIQLTTQLTNGVYNLIYVTNNLTGSYQNIAVYAPLLPLGQLAVVTNATPHTMDLLVVSGFSPSITWVGDGGNNYWDTSANSHWKDGGGNPIQYASADIVTFDDSGNNANPVNLDTSPVYPNFINVNSTNKNYTLGAGTAGVVANIISGGASLTKNGPGTLTLQSVNDYLGGTVINGGVVQLNGAGTDSAADGMVGSSFVTNNGTLIANNATNETLAGNLAGTGSLMQQGVGKLILSGNNSGFSGPITVTVSNSLQVGNGISGTLGTGTVTNNGTVIFNVSGSLPVGVNITGSGSVSNVAGTVTLSGTDTYAGATAVNGGKLVVGSANAIPNTTALILNDNTNGSSSVGTLDLNGRNITVASLSGNNTGNGLAALVEGLILNNGTTTNTLTINGGTTNTYNGQILDNNISGSGKVALSIINGSQLTLVASVNNANAFPYPNTFGGGVTISNATLALGSGQGSTTVATASGTDALGGNPLGSQTVLMTGTNAVFFASGSGGSTSPTYNTALGTITVTTNTTAWIYGPQRGQLAATALTGSGNIIYQPNYVRNRVTFGNASGFTGTITIEQYQNTSGGNIGYDNPLGLPNANVIFGITNVSTVDFAGSTGGNVLPFGSLSGGDNTAILDSANGSDGGANTIYVIGTLNTSTAFGGIVQGASGIRKVGTGTLTLTNNVLSWTGQTVVSNGTLAFAPLGLSTNIASIIGTPGDPAAITNYAPVNYPLNNNYLVGTNITIVDPGILDLSRVGGNTLYLGHNGAQTLFGDGTIQGNLVATNNLIAPAWGVNSRGTFPGNLRVTGNAEIDFGSMIQMAVNSTVYDSLTVGGTLTVNSARLTVITNGPAFANGSSNVFYFFNSPAGVHHAVLANTIGSAGTVGITNIILPNVPNSYWVTNLTLDGSMALVNTSPAVSTTPFTLTNSYDGVNVTLSWPLDHTGYRLQAQTNTMVVGLYTNWVDVAGATTTNKVVIPVSKGNGSVFYRLIYP